MKADTLFNPPPTRRVLGAIACAGALLIALALPAPAGGDKDEPDKSPPGKHRPSVFPIKSRPYGKSYGNWGAAWWSWVLGIPKAQNPNFDPTGEFAHVNQEGPVFFLAGNFGGVNERTISVPAGKALFFPILNNVYWASEDLAFVKDVIAPSQGWDLSGLTDAEILRMGVNWATDHATSLSVTIDDMPVKDPWQYRADSAPFTLELSDALADFGYPAGPRTPSVSDGYWIMLRPLPPGKHTIRFASTGRYSVADGDPFDQDFSLDVTYHIKVVRSALIFPPRSHPYGKSYGGWSARFWETGIELPLDGNPLVEGGCGELSGRVTFLAAPIATKTLDGTVPAGTALFVPALTVECSSLEPPESGFHGDTEEEQRDCAKFWSDHIVNPSVEIDGLPVPDIARYRVVSPQFDFTAPDPNILGVAGGGAGTSVADGYYLMVAPLARGAHTIRVRGALRFSVAAGDPFDLDLSNDVLFNITVE